MKSNPGGILQTQSNAIESGMAQSTCGHESAPDDARGNTDVAAGAGVAVPAPCDKVDVMPWEGLKPELPTDSSLTLASEPKSDGNLDPGAEFPWESEAAPLDGQGDRVDASERLLPSLACPDDADAPLDPGEVACPLALEGGSFVVDAPFTDQSMTESPGTPAPPVYSGALERLLSGASDTTSPIAQILTSLVLQDPGSGLFLHDDGFGLSLRVDKPGSGQDAPPLFLRDSNGHALIAIMDGMGGSGGTLVNLPGIGDHRPNAYFASRLTARALMDLAMGAACLDREHQTAPGNWSAPQGSRPSSTGGDLLSPGTFAGALGPYLHRRLKGYFADCVEQGLVKVSRMRGRMVKDLPTTLTMAIVNDLGDRRYAVDTFNCGDSRVYVLETASQGGLAWLTLDSIGEPIDAMQCLKEDPPITAMISGSKEEAVVHRRFELMGPFILLACSDGFHHYDVSPLDLEVRVLESMRSALSVSDANGRLLRFGGALLAAISARIEDDITLALRFVGGDPADLIEQFVTEDDQTGRSQTIRSATDTGQAGTCWSEYRGAFERYLPVPREDGMQP